MWKKNLNNFPYHIYLAVMRFIPFQNSHWKEILIIFFTIFIWLWYVAPFFKIPKTELKVRLSLPNIWVQVRWRHTNVDAYWLDFPGLFKKHKCLSYIRINMSYLRIAYLCISMKYILKQYFETMWTHKISFFGALVAQLILCNFF